MQSPTGPSAPVASARQPRDHRPIAHVEIIDQSLRDGVQSLWGMRIRAGMVTGAGRHLDRAGYDTVELPSGSFFSVLLRYLREDPIEA